MKFIREVSVIMFFSFLLGVIGCGKIIDNPDQKQESIQFAKFTQEERINYVEEYLKTEYGVDTHISEVEKKQLNVFFSEDMYFAIAKCEDGNEISCWVTDEGEILDSMFLYDMRNPINNLFDEKINGKLKNYQIRCNCTLNSPTKKTWTEEQLMQMLESENIEVYVSLFIDYNEKKLVEDLGSSVFEDAFSFADGHCYIYFVENIDANTIKNVELINYDLYYRFKKR